jgi:hypothetical protein
MQLEQVIGVSAMAGTSLLVFKIAMYAVRSKGDNDDYDSADSSDDDDHHHQQQQQQLGRAASLSLLGFIRRILRKLLLDDPEASRDAAASEDVPERGDSTVITHQGSCHCESIRFELLAPRCLKAMEGPGKIQYRHAQIKAANFRVYAGHECLKTYYVFRGNARKGAHAFCERCGVHVLFAPSKSTPLLNINVNCLMGNGISKIKVVSKKDNISQGFAADGQWDTSDQLSTISEVTQPFHFQMSHMTNRSDSGDWKQYNRNSSDLYSVGEGNSIVDDDEDNNSAPIKKVSVPPIHPSSTPTTASSSTIEASSYGSQLVQLKMMAANGGNTVDDLTNDDMSLSDEASLSSAHHRLLAGSSSSPSLRRRTLPGLPRANTTTASPEMRNKMRYFMGKYKHQHDYGDRGSQKSSATATTSSSSLTTSS